MPSSTCSSICAPVRLAAYAPAPETSPRTSQPHAQAARLKTAGPASAASFSASTIASASHRSASNICSANAATAPSVLRLRRNPPPPCSAWWRTQRTLSKSSTAAGGGGGLRALARKTEGAARSRADLRQARLPIAYSRLPRTLRVRERTAMPHTTGGSLSGFAAAAAAPPAMPSAPAPAATISAENAIQ